MFFYIKNFLFLIKGFKIIKRVSTKLLLFCPFPSDKKMHFLKYDWRIKIKKLIYLI